MVGVEQNKLLFLEREKNKRESFFPPPPFPLFQRDGRGEFSSLRSSYPERGSRSGKSGHNFSFVFSIVINLHSSLLQFSVSEPQFSHPSSSTFSPASAFSLVNRISGKDRLLNTLFLPRNYAADSRALHCILTSPNFFCPPIKIEISR